jgi:hypothetical protein
MRTEHNVSTEQNIAAVCREFTDALVEVLAESAAVCPVRRGRVARAHAAIKRHRRRSRLSHAHKAVPIISFAAGIGGGTAQSQ